MSAERIRVTVRMRPLNAREKSAPSCYEQFRQSGKSTLTEYTPAGQPKPNTTQSFDHVFGPAASTDDIFDTVGRQTVDSTLQGINGTIFAYGQTSSGKTFTMNGDEEGDFPGLLPLSALHIFDCIERETSTREFLVRVSFVEIYNEVVTDLLNPKAGPIKIRESRSRGVFVESEEVIVSDFERLIDVFNTGSKSRHVGSTSMNERSSRSHTIFRITIESKLRKTPLSSSGVGGAENAAAAANAASAAASSAAATTATDIDGAVLVATLSLVDLAGSENARNTGAKGVRLREGGNINKSLLTLSGVIKTLSAAKGQACHVRFRDSKLTRLLQPSLVGNCRTSIIACVTPAVTHAEETRSTLRFATSAKTLSTQTSVNEVLDDAAMIRRLKRELHELKKGGMAAAAGTLKGLENDKKNLEDEAAEMRAKVARMREITANLITGRGGNHHHPPSRVTTTKTSKRRTRKQRETWCPSEIKKNFAAAGGLGGGFGGLGSVAEDDDVSFDGDDSIVSDISLDSSVDCMSAHKALPRSTSMGGGILRRTRVSFDGVPSSTRMGFTGGSGGGGGGGGSSGAAARGRRRVSFGDALGKGGALTTSSSATSFDAFGHGDDDTTNIRGLVLRSKGAKIASQAERLTQLEQDLAFAQAQAEQRAAQLESLQANLKAQAVQVRQGRSYPPFVVVLFMVRTLSQIVRRAHTLHAHTR